jgi:hypothetical protein
MVSEIHKLRALFIVFRIRKDFQSSKKGTPWAGHAVRMREMRTECNILIRKPDRKKRPLLKTWHRWKYSLG